MNHAHSKSPCAALPPPTRAQVLSVNGEEVKSMKQLVRLVRSCTDEWLSITLDHNQKVVLNMGRASQASPSILKAQCIPSDRSPDLLGV